MVNMFVLYSGNDTEISSKCIAGNVYLSWIYLLWLLDWIELHLASYFTFAYQESSDAEQLESHYDL